MNRGIRYTLIANCLLWLLTAPAPAAAQAPARAPAQAPPVQRTPKAAAPIDITGYWVPVITEDWRHRMAPPRKGDFESLPLNAEARRIANAWDPAQVEAAGEQCKAYGAPAIMRMPGRLNITWENDNVLKIDFDAGTQTRRFYFGSSRPAAAEPSWQGISAAQWDIPVSSAARGPAIFGVPGSGGVGGALKAVTTNLRPGFLRRNGVPYSKDAVVTEWFDLIKAHNGDQWLIVKTVVEDPAYLNQPFITSTHFKKQAGAEGWNPTPCEAR